MKRYAKIGAVIGFLAGIVVFLGALAFYVLMQRARADLEEIRRHGHVLTPGRYVGAAPQADDGEPFDEKMVRLAAHWRAQRSEAERLDAEIEANLRALGYGP